MSKYQLYVSKPQLKIIQIITVLMLLLNISAVSAYHCGGRCNVIYVNEWVPGEFGEVNVSGFYKRKYKQVYEEFIKNFTERGELGASVSLTKKGKTVVDLWGGFADAATEKPWDKDTISIVWSSTKGATAFALHMLASRGLVDYKARVSDYWPEYGQNGKENTTIEMILDYQSGVQHFTELLPEGAYADWDYMVNVIENQSPYFEPGKEQGYQALTQGWLVGEIVRRVSGKTLGTFINEEIAQPLNADFWLGLPAKYDPRVATMILPAPEEPPLGDFWSKVYFDPASVQAGIFFNSGGFMFDFDTPHYRRSEIGAANGYTNARGLARLYIPLANNGRYKGVKYVNQDTLARMESVRSAGYDKTLLLPLRFSLGFLKSIDNSENLNLGNRSSLVMSEAAFGHAGFGGSIGFADPKEKVTFAYTMNKMGQGLTVSDRGQSLVDALYRQLGYDSKTAGVWIKNRSHH